MNNSVLFSNWNGSHLKMATTKSPRLSNVLNCSINPSGVQNALVSAANSTYPFQNFTDTTKTNQAKTNGQTSVTIILEYINHSKCQKQYSTQQYTLCLLPKFHLIIDIKLISLTFRCVKTRQISWRGLDLVVWNTHLNACYFVENPRSVF